MKFSWIIFDADGTLFDYDATERDALQKTFGYFNQSFEPSFLDLYRKYNTQMWDRFERGDISLSHLKSERFKLFLSHVKLDISPSQFSNQYLNYLSGGTQLVDGAEELLKALFGRIKLLLMTNGIKEVQRSRLSLSPIAKYFEDFIISDEVGVAKPDQQIFQIALKRMNRPEKSEILMVGDNLSSDIRGGLDFGIATCWFNPRQLPKDPEINADFEIQTLSEIFHIIDIDT